MRLNIFQHFHYQIQNLVYCQVCLYIQRIYSTSVWSVKSPVSSTHHMSHIVQAPTLLEGMGQKWHNMCVSIRCFAGLNFYPHAFQFVSLVCSLGHQTQIVCVFDTSDMEKNITGGKDGLCQYTWLTRLHTVMLPMCTLWTLSWECQISYLLSNRCSASGSD